MLSQEEQALISAELFPPEYRRQIEPNLVRIEAFLTGLAQYTEQPGQPPVTPEPPAYYTCLALEPAARSARAEVLAALTVQWLTVQVTSSNDPAPAVIIAGADEISRPHLERLAGACERRGVPLTLLFRHLRETGLGMLGGGAAAFMRLGHHGEAEQAAAYIGRQHRFVLSNVTASLGGSDTQTLTETEGQSVTDTIHIGGRTGWAGGRPADPGAADPGPAGARPRRVPAPLPQQVSVPQLVHRPVLGREHQLEQRRGQPAGLRVRGRARGTAEPPRPGPAAGDPRFGRPGADVRGMRPGYRHHAPGQHRAAA